MRKITRKGLVRKLDALVKEIVIKRHPYCVICGATSRLEPGHIFTRKYYSTRWDLNNVWTQCHSCNLKHVHDTYPFFHWYETTFGQKKFDELHVKFLKTAPVKDWQLQELYDELKTFQNHGQVMTYPNEKVDTFEDHDKSVANENTK